MAQPHNKKLGEYPMTTRGREQGPEKRYRRLRFPAFTAAKWTAANPLLQRGELGIETDTRKIKVGDGITYWNDLEYSRAETTWGEVNGDITDQVDLVEYVAEQIKPVQTELTNHKNDTDNPHNVTKAQVGLGNVNNTSDIDKPVSNAQATAINNAVSEHNTSDTAHSNLFSQYRTSANQDNIDSNLQSQITNNDTDITNLQNTKADKATTLAGYGITDAYTKTQVDQKINDVQGDVDTLNTKVPPNASASNKMATAAEISNLQNQIDENALEIKGLQGAGGALTATNLGSNPTQQSITEYAIDQIWPNNTNFTWNASNPAASTFTDANGIARTAAEIFNGTWVNNTADNMRWQLTNTQNTTPAVFEWANVGQDIVGIASVTTAGIIRVGDGSQMVVSPATGDISLDASKASEIRDTIGAIANAQGTANAGKVLGIGSDGNVAPVPAPNSAIWGQIQGTLSEQTDLSDALNKRITSPCDENFDGKITVKSLTVQESANNMQDGDDWTDGIEGDTVITSDDTENPDWYLNFVNGMPSNTNVDDLGTFVNDRLYTFIAPDDGWYCIGGVSQQGSFLSIKNVDTGMRSYISNSFVNNPIGIFLPVKKGTNVEIRLGVASGAFGKFIHAEKTIQPMKNQVRWIVKTLDNLNGTNYENAWCIVYNDGWVEQGGCMQPPKGPITQIDFPIEMADTNYTLTQGIGGRETGGGYNAGYRNATTTGFVFVCHNAGSSGDNYGGWRVCGYADPTWLHENYPDLF